MVNYLCDQNDLFPNFADMPDDEFYRLMSIQDVTSSDLFSDGVLENNDLSKHYNSEYLKMSYGEGKQCSDEGIENASNL